MTRGLSTALALLFSLIFLENVHSGTIIGIIKFLDPPPKVAPIKVSKDQDYCGETLPNEIYVTDASGGLKNVVVSLEDAPASPAREPQKLNIIENNGCRYAPRIVAMQRGEQLKVRNADPKLHIPHSYLQEKTVFMLSLPFRNTTLDATHKIREPGIMKLVCDTHAWMLGYVHVFDHRYFAVTDERGGFVIANVPAGTYVLKAWHEDAGVRNQEITVSENGEVRVGFEFSKKPQSSGALLQLPSKRLSKYSFVPFTPRVVF
jgi:hypothetical protein